MVRYMLPAPCSQKDHEAETEEDEIYLRESDVQLPTPLKSVFNHGTPETAPNLSPWEAILHSATNQSFISSPGSDEERVEYFRLCLAAHFATVASYVPTDGAFYLMLTHSFLK
jgi:hypothetical protein